ncbi:C40 family peptidase [Streptomyces sp. CB01373]|uniref:C40 family peptidase n=1 Tax=Streptomyces sp. CB01373 TaxID=2020325 RepID=UPI001F1A83DE|nr:C40 family peptidase [Streptomyces sp. CB01373]
MTPERPSDDRPSRAEVQQRISSLYDQAENATGNFNATRAMSNSARTRRGSAAWGGSGGSDPAVDRMARKWFDVGRAQLGPTRPAVLPPDRMPKPADSPAAAPGRRPADVREGLALDAGRAPRPELPAGPVASAPELPAAARATPELPAALPVAELTARPMQPPPPTGTTAPTPTTGTMGALPNGAMQPPSGTMGALSNRSMQPPATGTMNSLPNATIGTPPAGTMDAATTGTMAVLPNGAMQPPTGMGSLPDGTMRPPTGTMSALTNRSMQPPPTGTMNSLPNATIGTPPAGTMDAATTGTMAVLPNRTMQPPPTGSLGPLPSATGGAPATGTMGVLPNPTMQPPLTDPLGSLPGAPTGTLPPTGMEAPPTGTMGVLPNGAMHPATGAMGALPNSVMQPPPTGSLGPLPNGTIEAPTTGTMGVLPNRATQPPLTGAMQAPLAGTMQAAPSVGGLDSLSGGAVEAATGSLGVTAPPGPVASFAGGAGPGRRWQGAAMQRPVKERMRSKLAQAGEMLARHAPQQSAPPPVAPGAPGEPAPKPEAAQWQQHATGLFDTTPPLDGNSLFDASQAGVPGSLGAAGEAGAAPGPATGPSVPESPAAAYERKAAKALAFARGQIGKPCVWGATGPGSYDCSSLTQAAWRAADVALPRTTHEQVGSGAAIELAALEPGDLIFFYGEVSHVGLYAGNGTMIHAPSPGASIREESIFFAGPQAIHSAIRPA